MPYVCYIVACSVVLIVVVFVYKVSVFIKALEHGLVLPWHSGLSQGWYQFIEIPVDSFLSVLPGGHWLSCAQKYDNNNWKQTCCMLHVVSEELT